ncbi:hypothetical protein T440DRAFT_220784 [Plenodomus tracheiphilus IPT5]|uniref:Uncharacterized protein n=1 Tax=Plenodomus tracheiphilus IPT5 TaxID=1408161 RepID=A0A6A7AUV7_9PLEO|nr:hypothetical protein T440DRAFT_220784 [Plenodomus tracheiphilus IPT5]
MKMTLCDQRDYMGLQQEQGLVQLQENGLISLEHTPEHLVSIVEKNSKIFLLSLPAEIRNRIFKYTLGGNIVWCTITRCHVVIRTGPPRRYIIDTEHALLRVCRQIYVETALLPFSTNDFGFIPRQPVQVLWQRMLPGQRNAVTGVVIDDSTVRGHLCSGKTESLYTSSQGKSSEFPNLRLLVFHDKVLREEKPGVVERLSGWVQQLLGPWGKIVVMAMNAAGVYFEPCIERSAAGMCGLEDRSTGNNSLQEERSQVS